MTAYLLTGHKNMLRKVTPGAPWTYADGTPLATTDAYGSGSTYDWNAGTVTVGSNVGPYGDPGALAGTTQNIFYIFGGWSDPNQLDTIWNGGFTGEQWPFGNYDCGRCHTTGYSFDASGSLPGIPDAEFSRFPTDFTAGTSSWNLDGVQCERCHATWGHTASGDISLVSKPTGAAATALCLQCHREENVDTVNNQFAFGLCSDGVSTTQADCVAGGNTWAEDLIVYDGGSCQDGVSPDYNTCISAGSTWAYAPFFDHESGPTFLNGPHARFSGTISLANQNATDMTLTFSGTYNSAFTDSTGGNAGCTGCHDPHQSLTQATAKPFVKGCTDCHGAYSSTVTNHPTAAGSPFDIAGGDQNATCAVCHMSQSYHLFRISVDPSYSTFPPASVIANGGGQGMPNTAPDGKIANAVWSDLDLACGQCHVGSGLLTSTPSVPGITKDKPTLAGMATCIHNQPVIHASAGANGSVSPAGTTFVTSGATQTLTFTANPGFQVSLVTVDGQSVGIAGGQTATYDLSNITGCHTVVAQFGAPPTITATAGPNGTISPAGTTSVFTGANQTYTISPASGYQVQNVVIDGATSLGSVTTYTFSNVTRSHTIAASFTANTYTITGTGGPNGTVSPSTVTIPQGSSQIVSITPASGYHVATLTVDGVAQTPATSYTFTNVQANHSVAATFAANPAATITASAGSNGTITPAGVVNLLAGQTQSFSFTPSAGYKLGTVTVDGATVFAAYGYTFNNITAGAHTIAATFVPSAYTITATVAGGAGTITNNVDSTVISSGSGTTTVTPGGSITYTLTPASGYMISNLSVNSYAVPAASTYTFNNVQANQKISVIFSPITYKITATAGPNGSVSPSSVTVQQGANQIVSIKPASGYSVATLTVDGVAQTPATSYTFTNVQANHSVAATFAANPAATITATTDGNGAITPAGTVNLLAGQTQSFSFTPNAGYKLGTVTVDGATVFAAYGYTFNNIAAGPHTIAATFVPGT